MREAKPGCVTSWRSSALASEWPWTKLTDVVDLDDALVEKIGVQSDAQTAGRSLRELERIRDENLVGILQALKSGDGGRGWGAGKLLKDFEAELSAAVPKTAAPTEADGLLRLTAVKVTPAWVDYNGHMTEHRYLQVFGDTSDALLRLIGVDAAYVAAGHSYYTVKSHLRHLGEAKEGQNLDTTTQILAVDAKRLHVFHTIYERGSETPIATAEQMLLHVDTKLGQAAPASEAVLRPLRDLAARQAALPRPDGTGRSIGQAR